MSKAGDSESDGQKRMPDCNGEDMLTDSLRIWNVGLSVAMNKSKTRQFTDLLPKRSDLTPEGFIPLQEKPIRKVVGEKSTVESRHINWRKLEKRVYKLQSSNLQSLSSW
ncbi:hypothetical protein [Tolypothrix sp. VBCCA 56010]|uniref:hypothetical protein n=1 Tax=Tolypothrix sp. VBCCA 56010 TaxID=3137731 RepID=UPI003D7CC4CB